MKALTWPVKIVFAVIVLVIISTAISQIDSPTKPAQPVAISITAEQLYKEYEANEVAADLKYKNKYLRVKGEIRDIRKTIGDVPYVNLATGAFTHQVMVTFPAGKFDNQLATYSNGTVIEATGICTGKTLGMVGIDLR
jgi:tRNA(Ile2) C34 agmatinyltransferase TiaS